MVHSFLPKFSSRSERRLLALCKNNPNEEPDTKKWNKDAVQYLVKKLKKNLGVINELERAITQENANTKCVPIPKTPDNRLLVSHRRGLPQVIYCRLWRWPDLQSHHQLRAVSTCESNNNSINSSNTYNKLNTGVELKQSINSDNNITGSNHSGSVSNNNNNIISASRSEFVCVNPYHYERKKPVPLEPVLVPCPRIPPDLSTSMEDSDPPQPYIYSPTTMLADVPQQYDPTLYEGPRPYLSSSDSVSQQLQQAPHVTLHQQQSGQQQQQQQESQQQQLPMQSEQSQPQSQQSQELAMEQQPVYVQPHQQTAYQQQSQQIYQRPHETQLYAQQQQADQNYQTQSMYQTAYARPQQIPGPGSTLRHSINTRTEIARPFQFRQNKFAPMVCNRVEQNQSMASHHASYDSQGFTSQPPHSVYPQQQPPQPGQYSNPYPTQQPAVPSSPAYIQPASSYQVSQTPYQPIYSQPAPYPQQNQMQTEYQQEVPMVVGTQTDPYYQQPAGPSHSELQVMQVPYIDLQEIQYKDDPRWCSISYHEYDQRIGEKYQPNSFSVSVDGYTHPMCNDRFCIGGLSNVNRNESIEWVRRRIGKGVKFTYVDGEVFVESLGDSCIFVSSPMQVEDGRDKVAKLGHGEIIRVFSNHQFSKLLSCAVKKGFEAVYKLTHYCTLRVGFVKGWGPNYKRQSILNTPCWVEVQLNGPLKWIDKVLRQMRPPQGCGSTS